MLKLVDISTYNTVTSWPLLKAAVSGVLIKCGQGLNEDSHFREHYAGALSLGMRVGIWWFYHPDMTAQPQVDKFMAIWNSLAVKPTVIHLDCEESAWVDTIGVRHTILPPNSGTYSVWLASWLAQVEALTGITPGIYTRATWWDLWVTPGQWSKYPLWVAHYGALKPTLPLAWKTWQFWQIGTELTPGILTPVDADRFDGTEAQLDAVFGVKPVNPINDPPGEVIDAGARARLAELEKWAQSMPRF